MDVNPSYFHVDPINLVVVIGAAVGGWYTLKNTSRWHTTWIKKHDKECDELRKAHAQILNQLQVSNAHLSTLVEAIDHRVGRIERLSDQAARR